MAATFARVLANRLNALKSTGPKTPDGKARSSRNALKHGLSRIGTRPPAEMADAILDRQQRWRPDYRPEGAAQSWHFERLVAESVRLDFCEARLLAARAEHAERAAESWDDDRAADAAALAARLAAHPDRIQPRLLQSRHGVLWLLDRWDEVAASLRRHEGWIRETWRLALDLLGVPEPARDGSGPWDLDPDDRSAAPGLALVASATAALRERLESYLDARDARARLDAEAGLDADDPPPIRLLERYAADARRRADRHLAELRRLQRLDERPSTPRPDASPPGPRPDRPSSAPCGPMAPSLDRQPPSPRPDPSPPRSSPPTEDEAATATPATTPSTPPPSAPAPTALRAPGLVASLRDRLLPDRPLPNRRARRASKAAARRS